MAYKKSDQNFYKQNWINNHALANLISALRPKRRMAMFLHSLWLPLDLLMAGTLKVIALASGKKRALNFWYLKRYFKRYFYYRGLSPFSVDPLPQSFKRPTVVFTCRHSTFSSLFLQHVMSLPLILPVHQSIRYLQNSRLLKWRGIGKAIRKISYIDRPLHQAMSDITSLLDKKFSVVVHLNYNYIDPNTMNTLFIHEDVFTLLEREDIDVYFMRMSGFEDNTYSSLFMPRLVSMTLKSKEELLPEINVRRHEVMEAIAEFYLFRYFRVVP